MDIRHDSDGFLLGAKIESLGGQLDDIHNELRAIKGTLADSVRAPTVDTPPSRDANSNAPPTPSPGRGSRSDTPPPTVVPPPRGDRAAPGPTPPASPPASPGGRDERGRFRRTGAVIQAVMAAAALVGILAVDPLEFSEVLASGWSERFVKLAREAEMLIRQ